MKRCKQCGEEKPIDFFSVQRGIGSEPKPLAKCKACVSAYQRARYVPRERTVRQLLEACVLGSWPLRNAKGCQSSACLATASRALLLKEIGSAPVLVALCPPCESVAMEACHA
jgi:hypothetical protein